MKPAPQGPARLLGSRQHVYQRGSFTGKEPVTATTAQIQQRTSPSQEPDAANRPRETRGPQFKHDEAMND